MIVKKFKPSMEQIIPFIIDAVESGKDVKLTVTGYSMYPLLESMTDSVFLTKPENISKYDIVLFKRNDGSHILHRVIKKDTDILTIAGDNEIRREYPVYISDVEAKVKAFERNGKYHSTDEMWYKLYERIWLVIFPFRHIAVRFIRFIAPIRGKVKKLMCNFKRK